MRNQTLDQWEEITIKVRSLQELNAEMLKALKRAHSWFDSAADDSREAWKFSTELEELIAKAEGRKQ